MIHTILVIDDEQDMVHLIRQKLGRLGYRVEAALNGREGLRKVYQTRPDLILLDIMMPGMDGWEVCRRLREMCDVPIIMVSARTAKNDVVKGLHSGADDYLTKPFSLDELEARVRALLRRSDPREHREGAQGTFYSNGYLSIDFDRRIVKIRGERVHLTPTEYALLTCLVRHAGRVLPQCYLLAQIWGSEYAEQVDYVKLYVRYLRRKIEPDPSNPVYVQTEWGRGYYFSTQ